MNILNMSDEEIILTQKEKIEELEQEMKQLKDQIIGYKSLLRKHGYYIGDD